MAAILPGGLDDGARGLADIADSGGRTYVMGATGEAAAGMPLSAAVFPKQWS